MPKSPSRRGYQQHARPSIFHDTRVLPYTFIAICCGGCYVGYSANQNAHSGRPGLMNLIDKHATCSLKNFREGRYYTLITSSFMHISPYHLLCNMLGLYSFGPVIVGSFGPAAFLTAWFGGSIACDSATLYWQSMKERAAAAFVQTRPTSGGLSSIWRRRPDANLQDLQTHAKAIGASGSVLALLGVYVGMKPHSGLFIFPIPAAIPAWIALTAFVAGSAYCVSENLFPAIGHTGHLGGIGFGLAYYYSWLRPWMRRFR